MEERKLLGFSEAWDGGFLEAILNASSNFHGVFGVAEEDCIFGNAGSIEGVVRALQEVNESLQGGLEHSLQEQ